jgi:hypothetical protein
LERSSRIRFAVNGTGVIGMGALDGKVAIVTGASRGIGAEIAGRIAYSQQLIAELGGTIPARG